MRLSAGIAALTLTVSGLFAAPAQAIPVGPDKCGARPTDYTGTTISPLYRTLQGLVHIDGHDENMTVSFETRNDYRVHIWGENHDHEIWGDFTLWHGPSGEGTIDFDSSVGETLEIEIQCANAGSPLVTSIVGTIGHRDEEDNVIAEYSFFVTNNDPI